MGWETARPCGTGHDLGYRIFERGLIIPSDAVANRRPAHRRPQSPRRLIGTDTPMNDVIEPADTLAIALSARYGAAAAGIAMRWNDTIRGLLHHRSVRAYTSEKLPPGTIETLVAAAQSAPSSSNLQVWSVIAVEDPERRARLAEYAGNQAHIREAPLLLVWLADLARLEALGAARGQPTEGLAFLETLFVGLIDAALAAQNALVAAESLGLGTVYIGAIRNRPEDVAALLGLPPNVLAVVGLVVGHPDPARPADIKPRLAPGVVLHRERYGRALDEAAIAAYDAELAGFQRGQKLPAQGWTPVVLKRIGSAAALNGRDRIAAALRTLGFGLR
jgi:nitroreductase